MGWSTREIAQLSGTTLRAVRHYHEIGLLEEPRRRANGYKSYRTEHLARLLQIRRLSGLGFSLAAIAKLDAESGYLGEALDAADTELAATIERLTRARVEIARLRDRPVPTDLPFDISVAATEARLSPTDRSLFAVLSHAVGDEHSGHWRALLQDYEPDAATGEFDELPADADEETRERLARHIAPQMLALTEKHPAPAQVVENASSDSHAQAGVMIEAMLDLYNPAQLDVLVRVWRAAGLI